MALEGRFFFPRSTRFIEARASVLPQRVLRIESSEGVVLAEVSRKDVRVSPRLSSLARRFDLSDGSLFQTDDNDGADALLRALGKRRRGRFTDLLERAWPVVALSIVVIAVALYFFAASAVPHAAEWLAKRTLPAVAHTMSEQTLRTLDGFALQHTTLSAAEQARATSIFARVAAHAPQGAAGYRLVFRGAGRIGANAFALPDGTIVMTDALWKMAQNDDEIEGVFAHEMSHVDHAHGLQRVYEASLFPAAIAIFTGDISQVSQMTTVLPGLIAQSAYSRAFEQQADDDAAALLRRMGARPSHMADFLERMDKKYCSGQTCPPSWISDHPDTVARAARLRAEDKGPVP